MSKLLLLYHLLTLTWFVLLIIAKQQKMLDRQMLHNFRQSAFTLLLFSHMKKLNWNKNMDILQLWLIDILVHGWKDDNL